MLQTSFVLREVESTVHWALPMLERSGFDHFPSAGMILDEGPFFPDCGSIFHFRINVRSEVSFFGDLRASFGN